MERTDQLLVEQLSVEASIGVFDWEKEVKQTLVVSLCAESDFSSADNTDDIADTVSYADLCESIKAVIQSQHHDLLEYLANRICTSLFSTYPLLSIDLTIMKPGAVPDAEQVGIRTRRKR